MKILKFNAPITSLLLLATGIALLVMGLVITFNPIILGALGTMSIAMALTLNTQPDNSIKYDPIKASPPHTQASNQTKNATDPHAPNKTRSRQKKLLTFNDLEKVFPQKIHLQTAYRHYASLQRSHLGQAILRAFMPHYHRAKTRARAQERHHRKEISPVAQYVDAMVNISINRTLTEYNLDWNKHLKSLSRKHKRAIGKINPNSATHLIDRVMRNDPGNY